MIDLKEKYIGSMMGLAIGDAIGTSVEFKKRGTFEPIVDMIGGGPFNLKIGEWTDDTSMALCLAKSLIDCNGFDSKDQMNNYLKWYKKGYMSSNGKCFDIGITTSTALNNYLVTGNPYSGNDNKLEAGNGSLMRLAPIPLFFRNNKLEAIDNSEKMSKTTHGALTCIDACKYYTYLIIGALKGIEKIYY